MKALGRQGAVAVASVFGNYLKALAEGDHVLEKLKYIAVLLFS